MKETEPITANTVKWELINNKGRVICWHSVPHNLKDRGYQTFLSKALTKGYTSDDCLTDDEIFQLRRDCIDAELQEDKLQGKADLTLEYADVVQDDLIETLIQEFSHDFVDRIQRVPKELCGEYQFYSTIK